MAPPIHQRTLIRQAIVDALGTETIAGENVFANRRLPLSGDTEDPELPALLVYCKSDPAVSIGDPKEYIRTLSVDIVAMLSDGEDFDDAEALLDSMCAEVEAILCPLENIEDADGNVLAYRLEYKGSDDIDKLEDGDQTLFYAKMTFEMKYQLIPDRMVENEFRTVNFETELTGNNDTPEAVDTVSIPQS